MSIQCEQRTFPAGCTITNIHQRQRGQYTHTYAHLIGPDGVLLISATLEYIARQLESGVIAACSAE